MVAVRFVPRADPREINPRGGASQIPSTVYSVAGTDRMNGAASEGGGGGCVHALWRTTHMESHYF